ncbi:MAG: triose-phosphate isomerase [bacterium]|nr:triose-phosphate isomerase [bacterium]
MEKKLIIANWKMHYGPIKAGAWIRAFRRERLPKDLDVAVAPPFISLASVRASLGRASIPALASQDVYWEMEGKFTGEVSPPMLEELGIQYCLVGHSERRKHFGETNETARKKAIALQAVGISPVLCVGETVVERRDGNALKTVRAQVRAGIKGVKPDGKAPLHIAYEPVWAIGSGRACSPHDIREMHEAIRGILRKAYGAKASDVRVLYGGSVDEHNILEYMTTSGIDGALVGTASLDPAAFGRLCRASIVT